MLGRIRPWSLLLAAVVLPLACAPLHPALGVTIDEIEKAWRERQLRFRSADLLWEETRVIVRTAADLQSRPLGPSKEQVRDLGDKRRAFEHAYKRRLVIADGKIRYEDNAPSWGAPLRKFTESSWTVVFNGQTGKDLRHIEEATWPYQGSVGPAPLKTKPTWERWELKPLRFFFQPFILDPKLLKSYAIVDGEFERGHMRCTLLRQIIPRRVPVVASLWLDRNAGFAVVSYTEERDGVMVNQFEMTYEPEPQVGPVPKAWSLADYNSRGELEYAIEAEVVSRKLNEPVPESVFDIEFPVGTFVIDGFQPPKPNGEPAGYYLVRPHAATRTVLPEELRATPDEIRNSGTGEALKGRSIPQSKATTAWIIVGLSSSLLGLIGLRVYYSLSRKS